MTVTANLSQRVPPNRRPHALGPQIQDQPLIICIMSTEAFTNLNAKSLIRLTYPKRAVRNESP